MKNRIMTVILVCFSAFTACSEDGKQFPLPAIETTVRLEGAIGRSTRAVIGSGYTKDLNVCFARQDETAPQSVGAYGTWSTHKAVRSGGTGNRPIEFAETQLYPVDGRNIRLHGYYPAEDGVTVDVAAGVVTFVIDGATDLMATGCLTAATYTPVSTCTFHHLLTQIQLVCYSDVSEKWGTITSVEAVGIPTVQQLVLSSGSPSLKDALLVKGIQNIPVPGMLNLPIPQIVEGSELPDPQGVVLLPVDEMVHSFRLQIVTTKDGKGGEKRTVSNVSISVEGGFLIGKRHIVSLLFTGGAQIKTSSVGVEAWTEQEQEEIPI